MMTFSNDLLEIHPQTTTTSHHGRKGVFHTSADKGAYHWCVSGLLAEHNAKLKQVPGNSTDDSEAWATRSTDTIHNLNISFAGTRVTTKQTAD